VRTRIVSAVLDRLQMLGRLLFGPLAVATYAGLEVARYGVYAAAASAYVVFLVAQAMVRIWSRRQLRLARHRLDSRRTR
jgi:hypothetical protein